MKKITFAKLAVVISLVLIAMVLLTACDDDSRLRDVVPYTPGGPFSTNINSDDPRRQVVASIVFEVIDEAAAEELSEINFMIRHAVLTVLGALTMEDMITERDLDALAERLVEHVNAEIDGYIDLVIGAYFTDFHLS